MEGGEYPGGPNYKWEEEQDSPEEPTANESATILSYNGPSVDYLEPPILSYSYSGISNASSNHELAIHSSRVSEELSHFTFIKAEKLYGSIQKMVADAKEVLMLEEDIILWIL
jgi:hypothetical protein